MPKGKRGKRDYAKELRDAVARMTKYPEHLHSARNDQSFMKFLDDIGVFENSYTDDDGNINAFWDSVRQKLLDDEEIRKQKGQEYLTITQLKKGNATVFRRKDTGQVVYRDKATGQFASREKIIDMSKQ